MDRIPGPGERNNASDVRTSAKRERGDGRIDQPRRPPLRGVLAELARYPRALPLTLRADGPILSLSAAALAGWPPPAVCAVPMSTSP